MRLSRPRSVLAEAQPESLFGGVFPAAGSGGSQDLTGGGDATHYVMGTHIRPTVNGTVTAVSWFCPTGAFPQNGDFAVGLVKVDPSTGIGGTITWLDWNTGATAPTAANEGTWVTLPLSAPVGVLAGDELYAAVRTDRYAFSTLVFVSDVTSASGHLFSQAGSGPYPDGAFVTGSDSTANPPNWAAASSFNSTFYGVDLLLLAA